jgi:hypothetical protein
MSTVATEHFRAPEEIVGTPAVEVHDLAKR